MNHRVLRRAGLLLLCLLMYGLVWLKTGFIPVNGGAGFDGAYYHQYILQIAHGEWPSDPYRMIRMAGFAPAILAVHWGLPAAHVVAFQAAINALVLSLAALAFDDAMLRLGTSRARAALATVVLFLSWPYWVMPIYYPLLSDHLALAMAVLALWAWVAGRAGLLLGLTAASVFVMPGLSLVPLALLALPYSTAALATPGAGWRHWVFAGLLGCMALLMLALGQIGSDEILHHPKGTTLGLPALRPLTLLALAGVLVGIAAAWTRLLAGAPLWQRLSWRRLLAGMLALGLAVLALRLGLDWTRGYRGPALVHNLLLQGLAAPGKPLVAQLVFFGPVFAVALVLCLSRRAAALGARGFPLLVTISAMLPVLALGSESRQWIGFYPLLVAFAVLHDRSPRTTGLLVVWSLVFTVGVFGLSRTGEVDQPGSMLWAYVVHQGPWMPNGVYAVMLPVLVGLAWAIHTGQREPDGNAT